MTIFHRDHGTEEQSGRDVWNGRTTGREDRFLHAANLECQLNQLHVHFPDGLVE
jgi:hypothetical protein